MNTPSDRRPSRSEQPPLFETPGDDPSPTPPAEPPVLYGRPRLRTANRDQIIFRAAALDEIIPRIIPPAWSGITPMVWISVPCTT